MINWRVATLLGTVVKPEQYPQHDLPEVALVGRSNVGKSSLINHLIGSRLARTSNTPGRTQTINFYGIDGRLCLVDLPGYGYAKVPQHVKRQWGPMIEGYLAGRPNLVGVLQIVDIRHPPTKDDKAMADWLRQSGFPAVAVATKADKISRGRRPQHVQRMAGELRFPVTAFSSVSGDGRNDVIAVLHNMLLEAGLLAELAEGSDSPGSVSAPGDAGGSGSSRSSRGSDDIGNPGNLL